jgi:hypothetical protein
MTGPAGVPLEEVRALLHQLGRQKWEPAEIELIGTSNYDITFRVVSATGIFPVAECAKLFTPGVVEQLVTALTHMIDQPRTLSRLVMLLGEYALMATGKTQLSDEMTRVVEQDALWLMEPGAHTPVVSYERREAVNNDRA